MYVTKLQRTICYKLVPTTVRRLVRTKLACKLYNAIVRVTRSINVLRRFLFRILFNKADEP